MLKYTVLGLFLGTEAIKIQNYYPNQALLDEAVMQIESTEDLQTFQNDLYYGVQNRLLQLNDDKKPDDKKKDEHKDEKKDEKKDEHKDDKKKDEHKDEHKDEKKEEKKTDPPKNLAANTKAIATVPPAMQIPPPPQKRMMAPPPPMQSTGAPAPPAPLVRKQVEDQPIVGGPGSLPPPPPSAPEMIKPPQPTMGEDGVLNIDMPPMMAPPPMRAPPPQIRNVGAGYSPPLERVLEASPVQLIDPNVIVEIQKQQEKDRKAKVRNDIKELADKYSTTSETRIKMYERLIREEVEETQEEIAEREADKIAAKY